MLSAEEEDEGDEDEDEDDEGIYKRNTLFYTSHDKDQYSLIMIPTMECLVCPGIPAQGM